MDDSYGRYGVLSLDSAWAGSNGSRGMNGITVNIGGIHIQDAGTTCQIRDGYAIVVNEGGQWRSLGTSGSRCAITGEDKTTNTHYIRINGKIFTDYTDISVFYYIGMAGASGTYEFVNSTISDMYFTIAFLNTVGMYLFINCTISCDTAGRYIFEGGYSPHIIAINTAFTSITDNHICLIISLIKLELYSCTYQGIPFDSGDIVGTAWDANIRIYEKSTVTVSGNLADAHVSPSHPELDANGMLENTDSYMKIPGFLSPDVTNASGVTNLYLLQKSAYWRSGLAVGSRTWFYHSDSGQAETGGNQKWSITGAKVGYVTDSDDVFAGQAVSLTIDAISGGGGSGGRMVQGMV